MSITLILMAMATGAIMSIYIPMISKTAQIMGSPPLANVPFFGIAFVMSIAIAVATGSRWSDFQKIPQLPPLLLTAGIMSAAMIIASSFLVPRIGIAALFVLLVSGQVLAAMVFGQLGLFGVAASTLTVGKIAGAMMVIGGVWLVTYT